MTRIISFPASQQPAGVAPYAGRNLVILNPAAGHDDPAKLRRCLGGAFAARGADFDLLETGYPGHARELAELAVQRRYRAVCVVGGDGTLAEVATGLAGSHVPLAVIPRGTANQVAQNLRIPTDIDGAVDIAVNGTSTPIDLGRIDDRSFTLVAGAGYDAAVMARATRELKERWGFAAYIYAAVKEALAAQPTRFHLEVDGRDIALDAVTVMVANVGELFAGYIPFRFPLAPRPTSSWQDGLLDVVVLAPRKLPEFATILWRAAHRRFGGDGRLIHFQAREVTITADPPMPVQVDGDPSGVTPVTARVERNALLVLAPPLG